MVNTKPKNDKKCTHCKKPGHSIEKYWKKYPNLRPKKDKPKDDKKDIPSETTLIIKDTSTEWALSTSETTFPMSTWLLDSGTTKHICAYKVLFTDLKPCETTLKWGNASTIKVNWSGSIRL